MITLSKETFTEFKEKNLFIRHLIAELMPLLDEQGRKHYQEFFKYSERLEKRLSYEG